MRKLHRIVASLAALLMLASAAAAFVVQEAAPAAAGTRQDCINQPGGEVNTVADVYVDIASGAPIGWASTIGISWPTATSCTSSRFVHDPAVVDVQVLVYRDTYGGPAVCFYGSGHDDHGMVAMNPNAVNQGNTGACASSSWPAGWTHISVGFQLRDYWGQNPPRFDTTTAGGSYIASA